MVPMVQLEDGERNALIIAIDAWGRLMQIR